MSTQEGVGYLNRETLYPTADRVGTVGWASSLLNVSGPLMQTQHQAKDHENFTSASQPRSDATFVGRK